MRIHLGGIVLDGTDAPNVKYTLAETEGLLGGVGVRGRSVDRPTSHGEFDLPVFRGARTVIARGLIFSYGLFEQDRDVAALAGVAADGERIRVFLSGDFGNKHFDARLSGGVDIEIVVPGQVAKYQVTLRAPDPRLYGDKTSFSGSSVSVSHYGNFPASPVVEVVGPRAAYTVSGPGGRVFQVLTALPSGVTDRINFRTGKLTRGGSVPVGVVGRADVWAVPPGKAVAMSISVGSMTVLLDDTYL